MRLGVPNLSLRNAKPVGGIAPNIVLTDVPGLFSGPGAVLSVDHSWLEGDGTPLELGEIFQTNGNDVCRIVLTSGSTGIPKGIAFSYDTWVARIAYLPHTRGSALRALLEILLRPRRRDRGGILLYLMSMFSRGGTIYFLGPEPADILQIFDVQKIDGMATSPYGLGEFLKYFEADSAFEVSLDHIICQGALLSRELSRRARARMCHNLYSTYGTTETAGVAIGPASVIEAIPGAVGYIQPGVTVAVVDNSGTVLPPGRDGSLRIRRHSRRDRICRRPRSRPGNTSVTDISIPAISDT